MKAVALVGLGFAAGVVAGAVGVAAWWAYKPRRAAMTKIRSAQPPTTAWGALLKAADILEQSKGLARISTLTADYKTGKLDPYAALQDALWPPPDTIPRIDGGIPADRTTGRPYWSAVKLFDLGLGGTGELWSTVIDQLTDSPDATAASVAARMREAARR